MLMKDYLSKISTLVKSRYENDNKIVFQNSNIQHTENGEENTREQKIWKQTTA